MGKHNPVENYRSKRPNNSNILNILWDKMFPKISVQFSSDKRISILLLKMTQLYQSFN